MLVNLSHLAYLDLEEIYDFIALDNPVRARSFTAELEEKAKDIALNPLMFAPLLGNTVIRKRSYKGYIILFEIKENSINIIRILNSMRDYASLLTQKPRKHP